MTDNRSVPLWRQYPKSTVAGAIAFLAIVAIFLVFPRHPSPTQVAANAPWARHFVDQPYHVPAREDLATAATRHNVSQPIVLTMWNHNQLGVKFGQLCDYGAVYGSWPFPVSDGNGRKHGYYCNHRLNLAPAHTLVPGEQISIPVEKALDSDVVHAVNALSGHRLIILVDGTSATAQSDNLKGAAQWVMALGRTGRTPADVWVYSDKGISEYLNAASPVAFDESIGGTNAAIAFANIVKGDTVVLITAEATDIPASKKKIVLFCMTSRCSRLPKTNV